MDKHGTWLHKQTQQKEPCPCSSLHPPPLNSHFCMATSLSFSISPPTITAFRFKLSAMASPTTVTVPPARVAPAVIVGGGRVGRALQDMGTGEDLLVRRGEFVPLDFEGPIFVCTRNDDLESVLQSTPPSRWKGESFLLISSLGGAMLLMSC